MTNFIATLQYYFSYPFVQYALIVGVLIEVGNEKIEPCDIKRILEGNYKKNYKKILFFEIKSDKM